VAVDTAAAPIPAPGRGHGAHDLSWLSIRHSFAGHVAPSIPPDTSAVLPWPHPLRVMRVSSKPKKVQMFSPSHGSVIGVAPLCAVVMVLVALGYSVRSSAARTIDSVSMPWWR